MEAHGSMLPVCLLLEKIKMNFSGKFSRRANFRARSANRLRSSVLDARFYDSRFTILDSRVVLFVLGVLVGQSVKSEFSQG